MRCYLRVMVEIKDAVRNAMAFAKDSLGPERTQGIRLEEVESSTVDSRPVWLITLSNALIKQGPLVPGTIPNWAIGADAEREYKVFTVAKDDGEILSMKIRLLAAPAL
jgi:hypothetical protein